MLALRIFDRMHASPEDPRVRAAVKYLVSTFDDKLGYWHAMPVEANVAPHAPWWDVHPDSGKCDVESPVFPTAAIAAHLRPFDAGHRDADRSGRSIERDPQKWSAVMVFSRRR